MGDWGDGVWVWDLSWRRVLRETDRSMIHEYINENS